jgi:hypothetical protein
MFKTYLNDIELSDEPDGLFDFTERIAYDKDRLGFIVNNPIDLHFSGQGFAIIKSLVNSNGYCQDVTFQIYSQCNVDAEYTLIYTGIIKLATCVFMNVLGNNNDASSNQCRVKCSVLDNGYMANISNNRNIKINLEGSRSKNGIPITPLTPLTLTTSGASPISYNISDVLEFLIAYISDNTILFSSTYLTTLTDDLTTFAITTGSRLRSGASDVVPTVSLEECLKEIHKKFNIKFDVTTDNYGVKTFIVEDEDYFNNLNSSVALSNVNNVELTFDVNSLYSAIKLGGESASYDPTIHNLPPIQMLSFKEEEYNFTGNCNTSSVLDLVSEWIIDSNIIQETIEVGDSDTYDDKIFLLEYVASTNVLFTSIEYTSSGLEYFNPNLLNKNCVERFNLQNDIVSYLGGSEGNNVFAHLNNNVFLNAVWATPQTHTFIFDDLVDVSGNYNNTTGVFTAPYDGVFRYQFNQFILVDTTPVYAETSGNPPIILVEKLTLHRLYYKINGGSEVVLSENTISEFQNRQQFLGYGLYFNFKKDVYLGAGDEIVFQVELTPVLEHDLLPVDAPENKNYSNMYNILSSNGNFVSQNYEAKGYVDNESSFMSFVAISTAGGIFENYSPREYNNLILKFAHPLRKDIWEAIMNNKNKSILINGIYKAWVKNIDRNVTKDNAECELVSNINTIPIP